MTSLTNYTKQKKNKTGSPYEKPVPNLSITIPLINNIHTLNLTFIFENIELGLINSWNNVVPDSISHN